MFIIDCPGLLALAAATELVASAPEPVHTEPMVPLGDAVATLQPQTVWQDFYQITQIPRPSHHEEKIREFLVQFGQGLGLETVVDDVGNVIIRKPAAAGMEQLKRVTLQAHMDIVPEKTQGSDHDFLTDPIAAYVQGDWVVTDGTTLGADNGIGIAIAMGVLRADTPPLGPLEALFTVNEEDGMDGAAGLQPGELQGEILVNLDSETEGELTIGSAGYEFADVDGTYVELDVPDSMIAVRVQVLGLQGGHSGMDIDKGRAHATKLLVRLLRLVAVDHDARVASLAGGTIHNAIPRDAAAVVVVPEAQAEAFLADVAAFEIAVRGEFAAVEPDLAVEAAPADMPARVMEDAAQATILEALDGTPQGVMRISDVVPGLVQTSTNMGVVEVADGHLTMTSFLRSSDDGELDDIGQKLSAVWSEAGFDVVLGGRQPGWQPDPASPILLLMKDVYVEMYGQTPVVAATHAGLECGTIRAKYPYLDAISIGPTIENVHTPDERLRIDTVGRLYDFVLETLQRVPEDV